MRHVRARDVVSHAVSMTGIPISSWPGVCMPPRAPPLPPACPQPGRAVAVPGDAPYYSTCCVAVPAPIPDRVRDRRRIYRRLARAPGTAGGSGAPMIVSRGPWVRPSNAPT
jgi:hypothetical protein